MPDSRQKYHVTIGYQNGQSVQAITFMSRDALRTALASEPDEFGLVHIDCRSGMDEHIDLDVSVENIQLLLHQKFVPQPQPSPLAIPKLHMQ